MPALPDLSSIPKRPLMIAALAIGIGAVVFLISTNLQGTRGKIQKAELNVWGIFEEEEMKKIFGGYKEAQPNVEFKYRKVSEENYETALLDALAAGEGPDMFMIRNRSLPKEINKIVPAKRDQITLAQLQEKFPKVVEQDFVSNGSIYALPIYLDTLALFYNKDVFDQAAVAKPPAIWQELQNLIPKFKSLSPSGQIIKAGAAIGGSQKTIHVAVDLLHLLMMQNGTPMIEQNSKRPKFVSTQTGSPGVAAFNFYLQFANAGSPYYTWNENQGSDIDMFTAGKAAMMFGYQSTVKKIRAKSPFLSFGISPMLQASAGGDALNYADYWGFAVSKKSRYQAESWNFVVYAATDLKSMKNYLQSTGRPPALKLLISQYLNDPNLGVFAKQAFTARSWYQINEDEITRIFSNAISRVLVGQTTTQKALVEAEDEVSRLVNK